jgi:hypothetical protein
MLSFVCIVNRLKDWHEADRAVSQTTVTKRH